MDITGNPWVELAVEFMATFIYVFIGASAVALTMQQGGSLLVSALAFGLVLMGLIYVWGPYSGAHVNPAVSFGFAVAGQMNWWLMLGYWVAQLIGAIAAGALVAYFFGTANGAGASVGFATNTDFLKAVIMEAFLTFFLVLAYLFVYRNPLLAVISGVAVGLTVTFCMLAGAPVSGASMNPARSLGTAIYSNNMGTYWIYVLGPLIGALIAALVYKLFTNDWTCCDKLDDCGKPMKDECGRRLKTCKRPVYDKCGNHLEDCTGKKYETYTKHEVKHGFKQETVLESAGKWLSAHGADPRYAKQEFVHALESGLPDRMVPNTQNLAQTAGANVAQMLGGSPTVNANTTQLKSFPTTPARTSTAPGSLTPGRATVSPARTPTLPSPQTLNTFNRTLSTPVS